MHCSGKTTFGRLLAKRFNCEFIDIDAKIVEKSGMSVRTFYLANGKEEFQKIEYEVFAECLSLQTTSKSLVNDVVVISVGGGLIENKKARLLIEEKQKAEPELIKVFFLYVPENILFNRLLKRAKRQASFPAFLQPYIHKTINEALKENRLSFDQLKCRELGQAKHKFFSINKSRVMLLENIEHIKLKTKRQSIKNLFKTIKNSFTLTY